MKILVYVALIFGVAASFAEDKSSGCGLGWQVSKDKSLVSSSIRATTNNLFYLNYFGMTSGTLGCAYHSIVLNDKKSLHYAEANYNNLQVEMAEGRGETLATFAEVMGCHDSSIPAFNARVQSSYQKLFDGANDSPAVLIERVRQEIQSDASLASACAEGV